MFSTNGRSLNTGYWFFNLNSLEFPLFLIILKDKRSEEVFLWMEVHWKGFLFETSFYKTFFEVPEKSLHRWSIFRSFIYLHLPLKDNILSSTNERPLRVHLFRKSSISKSKSESIKHVENLWRRLLDIGLFSKIIKNSSMSRSSCSILLYRGLWWPKNALISRIFFKRSTEDLNT